MTEPRWIDLLRAQCRDREAIELRALNVNGHGKRVDAGYFDNAAALRQAAALLDGQAQLYCTINPVNGALLARANNRILSWAKNTATDADICRRCWLYVDLDPMRPAGIPSTDAEHAAAIEASQEIELALAAEGFPSPVFADSGNGAALLYPVDLPNDEASKALIEGTLAGLAARFEALLASPPVKLKLDPTCSNASRICRLFGTVNRKGDGTLDRPHRRSRLLDVPAELVVVRQELLELAASWQPAPAPQQRAPKEGEPGAPAPSESESMPADDIGCGVCYLATTWPAVLEEVGAAPNGAKHAALLRIGPKVGRNLVGPGLLDLDSAAVEMVDQFRERCTDAAKAERTARQAIEHGARNPRRLADPPRCRLHGPARETDLPAQGAAVQAECERRDADEREALRQRPPAAPCTAWETAAELRQRPSERTLWVIPGLAARGALSTLAGEAKAGKSWLTLAALDAVAARRPGLLPGDLGMRGPVVYLTEEGRSTMRPKVERWRRADLHLLYARAARLGWEAAIEQAAARAVEVGAVAVVIDTWAEWTGLHGDAENQAGAARYLAPLAALCEQHHLGVLVLHHARKDKSGSVVSRVRGSGALPAAVDLIALLEQSAEGERSLELAGRFDDLPEALRFSIDPASGELIRSAGPPDDLRLALSGGPRTAEDLAAALGCDAKTARKRAGAMALAGLVTASGSGKRGDPKTWALADSGNPGPPWGLPDSLNPAIRPETPEFEGLEPEDSGNGVSRNRGAFPRIEDVL